MTEPRCTYRLQLHAGFTFADAAAAVPYLAELGVSHLYLSPVLQAGAGSTHGYDVVDPDRAAAQLGGDEGFAALVRTVRDAGLGILLDIVPNHMSIAGADNTWWRDVLENGHASYYAHFFDVDWQGDERVLLPVLGERYGRALVNGQLGVVHDGAGHLAIRAGQQRFPIAPRSLGPIVRRAGERIGHGELGFIGDAYSGLPRPTERDAELRRRRHRDKRVLDRRLAELCAADAACARAVDAEVAALAGDPIELDAVLEAQNYRLVHWTVSGSQLSYRRFFDINTLVGVRAEDADVFAAGHNRIIGWLADGSIDGVRVDHVDGLRDPAGYLARLRGLATPDGVPPWIVVEKILAVDEVLPAAWPIDGTSGYDAAARLTGLLVDPAGEGALTRTFELATDTRWELAAARRGARLEVLSDALHSELARLAELAYRACAASPACRDYTRGEVESALAQILAGYPVYRTYLDGTHGATGLEHAQIAAAVAAVPPDFDADLVQFLGAALAFELAAPDARELALGAQQLTGAVTAKGDEDTLGYRFVRLLARCEVGSDPGVFAEAPAAVHAALAAGGARGLVATSTHDTKRGEDVRARLAVLSEMPAAWDQAILRWRARAERHWDLAPDRTAEYTLWQTLVGAWPLPAARAQPYALKAAREARLRTSWRKPDAAYETALARWVSGIYGDGELLADIGAFVAQLAPHGDRNALAQLAIKLCAPGVPDLYQGTELRDDSLVDPDNRRPVDLDARRRALRELASAQVREIASAELGLRKLWMIRRVLALRARAPELFRGTYRPLVADGPHGHRVFAFTRGTDMALLTPRLGVGGPGWPETSVTLGAGAWRDVLADRAVAGGTQPIRELFQAFPVALLVRAS